MNNLIESAMQALEISKQRDIRVIVCGGRDYDDREAVYTVLNRLHAHHGIRHLFHGNARGADRLAHEWAFGQRHVSICPVPAQWKKHGKRAGPIRNQAMLGQSPDLVIAFPGGRGTADMVRRASTAGVPILRVPDPRRDRPDNESTTSNTCPTDGRDDASIGTEKVGTDA